MGLMRFGVLFTGVATGALAVAGPREEVLARAAGCASIVDDAAWLACYRAAAAPMEASLAGGPLPAPLPAAAPAPAPAPAPNTAPVPGFGTAGQSQANPLTAPATQLRAVPETAATDHITAHVVRYSFSSQKYFTVVLDNGQVWQQINGDNDFAALKGPPEQYEATIKHGFFGSYNLTFNGVAGLFRVRRIT
jgi:hypothetical protein